MLRSLSHAGVRSGSSSVPKSGILNAFLRHFSRKRAENLRKTNPRVPPQEATVIAQSLYDLIRQRGPLTVSNTWVQAKEAGVEGINSKTHLKLMLKWMRARNLLKLFCQQVRTSSNKRFFVRTLPDEGDGDGGEGNGEGEGVAKLLKTVKRTGKKKKKGVANKKKTAMATSKKT